MSVLSITDLHRIFEKLDTNNDGFVSVEEMNFVLQKICNSNNSQISLEELESLIEKKSLDFNEFLFFYNSISKPNNDDDDNLLERDLVKTFKVFDLDGDGFITSQELEYVLKKLGFLDEKSGKDCRSMIQFYDTNLDGRLDFQEFKNMMLFTTA